MNMVPPAKVPFDTGNHQPPGHGKGEKQLRDRLAADIFHDPVIKQAVDSGNCGKEGGTHLDQILTQFFQRFGKGNRTTDRERQKQTAYLFKNMVDRQKREGMHAVVDRKP